MYYNNLALYNFVLYYHEGYDSVQDVQRDLYLMRNDLAVNPISRHSLASLIEKVKNQRLEAKF